MGSINGLGSSNSAWAAASSQRTGRLPGGADAATFQDKLQRKLDTDGSGGVESGELQGLLDTLSARLGTAVGGSDSAAAFSAMDQNSDGSLDKAELDSGLKSALASVPDTLAFARSRGAGPSETERFAQADADGSGGISADELKAVMAAAPHNGGAEVPQDAVDGLMSKLDSDGSGEISASEMEAGKSAHGQADAPGRAGGPPSGPPPGQPPGAGAAGGSSSSSSSSTDPLDTNGDGTVSAAERAAGELKEMLQALAKAADSDSDGQISGNEAQRLGELLTRLAGSGSGSAAASSDSGGRQDQRQRDGAQALADQVLRRYAWADGGDGGGLSLQA
jgi:hypothetical protein